MSALGLFLTSVCVGWAEDTLVADGPALLREWVAPVYPPIVTQGKLDSTVQVRTIIDASGHVTAARALPGADPRLADAAVTAVKQWRFAPAVRDGKSVASCVDAPVLFSPEKARRKLKPGMLPPMNEWPTAVPVTPAQKKYSPSFDYPADLTARFLPGLVRFQCQVTPEGKVNAPRILATSHVDLVLPALAALKNWEFTPRMEGDLPVASESAGQFDFGDVFVKRAEILTANGITAPDGSPPSIAPEPLWVADPVWPLDDLLAGKSGSAKVQFTVTESGNVTDLQVLEASAPQYGRAVVAALQGWQFSRPTDGTQNQRVTLVKSVTFKAVPLDAPVTVSDPFARVVVAMRHGEIGSAHGLDQRLTPLYRLPPLYPAALKQEGSPQGEALIEFVIDREGRARLPRIVEASREEFGWAAATAVSQWVFAPPTRHGQPVDVRVRIPIGFAAPQE